MPIVMSIDQALRGWDHAQMSLPGAGLVGKGNDDCQVSASFETLLVTKLHRDPIPEEDLDGIIKNISLLQRSIGVASSVTVVDHESGGKTIKLVSPRLIPLSGRLEQVKHLSTIMPRTFTQQSIEEYLLQAMRTKINATMWSIAQHGLLPDADWTNWGLHPLNRALLLFDFFGAKSIDDVSGFLNAFLQTPTTSYPNYLPGPNKKFCVGSPLDLMIRIVWRDISVPVSLGLYDSPNNQTSRAIMGCYLDACQQVLTGGGIFPPLSTRQDRGKTILERELRTRNPLHFE